MFACTLAFNPRSKATDIGYTLSLVAVFWLDFVKIKMQWGDLRLRTDGLRLALMFTNTFTLKLQISGIAF